MKIPIKVYEELDLVFGAPIWIDFIDSLKSKLQWVEGVPYKVTVVNK